MIANRFAEGYDKTDNMKVEDTHRRVTRTPSPRDIVNSINMEMSDYLANRVSFYMDDAIIIDEVCDGSPALSRQSSGKQYPPRHFQKPYARGRSFRIEHENRPRLYRHGSDIGPGKRFQHNRRSCRRQPIERVGSLRSSSNHQRSAHVRRHSSTNSRHSQSLQLPHPELPPKERRRRTVVLIVIITFMFLVMCSVLVVVITLTHSSFYKSNYVTQDTTVLGEIYVRKENEELLNAISREGNLNGYYNNSASSSPLDSATTAEP